jgi:YVTN family beta-propeller protein
MKAARPSSSRELAKQRKFSPSRLSVTSVPANPSRLVRAALWLLFGVLLSAGVALPQSVTSTIGVGNSPVAIAVNPVTSTIYVVNTASDTVSVINGATNSLTTTVNTGSNPVAVAVNPLTNMIYVANNGSSNITVINGATNVASTVTDPNAISPIAVALNPLTNMVYVANSESNNLTVINGAGNTLVGSVGVGNIPAAVVVNPATNMVYVANRASNNVTVVNGANNTIAATVGTGTNPDSLAVDTATDMVYAANNGSNNLTVINGASNTVAATVGVGTSPAAVTVNPVSDVVYVANNGSGNVTVINGANNTVTATVATGNSPIAVAADPTTDQIYVVNNASNSVTVIDGVSNATTTVADSHAIAPVAVAVDPVTNTVYTANNGSANVTVVDADNNLVTTTLTTSTNPSAVALDTVTNKVYVVNSASNTVSVIDGTTNLVVATVNTGTNPVAIALNPASNTVYVANKGNNTVTVIDGSNNSVVATIPTGTNPVAVAVNPVTDTVYVANNGSGNVTVINGANNSVTTTVSAGTTPVAIAVNPATGLVYVANNGSDNITVFDPVVSSNVTITDLAASRPIALAVDSLTGKIYVANSFSDNVTVIDGTTALVVATINVGDTPSALALNPITNRVYVTNSGNNTVSVIDGTALAVIATVQAGTAPSAVSVNATLNRIYVANNGNNSTDFGGVTVIDGSSNASTAVTDANANQPFALAANPVTGEVYVANNLSSNTSVITAERVRPNPIATAIAPLVGNQTSDETPTFNFSASNGLSAAPVDELLFQMDTWLGSWTPATPTTHGNFTGTTTPLLPGFHTIFAYATEGEEATSTISGAQSSPLIGTIAAYGFLVATPLADVAPPSLSFGNQQVGTQSSPQTVTLGNPGSAPLTFTYGLSPGDFFEGPGDTCSSAGGQLAPNSSCTVFVVFKPSTPETENSTLTFTDNSNNISDSTQTVTLSGTGTTTSFTLNVAEAGTGGGTVTSNPAGINCPTTSCAANFSSGTSVTLTAAPNAGSTFVGWSGACSGGGACTVTMNSNQAVTATFKLTAVTSCTGTTDNWIGGASGNWSNPSNWSNGVPNGGGVNVCINDGNPTPSQVTLDINASVGALYIDSGSSLTISNGQQLSAFGNISNAGQIFVNAAGNNTFLTMGAGVSLTGGGSVTLSKGGNGTAALATSGGSQLLTNVDNTLQGTGVIGWNGLLLTNQAGGIINANTPSTGTLSVNTPITTNQGLLEATAGGTLGLQNSFNNLGGRILASGSGSTVQFISGSVQGGTLATASNGTLTTPGGNAFTLDGSSQGTLTIAGTYVVGNGATTFLTGMINNTGAIQVNAVGNNTFLTMSGGVSLTGGGSVTLSKGGNGTAAIATSGGSQTLTNVNNTLQGTGVIGWNGLNLVNQAGGIIDGNTPSTGTLAVNTPNTTNQGLLEATAGGTLGLQNSFNNLGGRILASGAGSSVQFISGSVQGGTLATASNGILTNPPGDTFTLDGSSQGALAIAGTYVVGNGATTFLTGTINNMGAIQVNAVGNNTFLSMSGGVSLTGAGSVTVSKGGNGTAAIASSGGAQTLINVNNTLQGAGVIGDGLNVINQGTINANLPAQGTLELNPGALTNEGLLEATAAATLQLNGSVFNNTGGTILASGTGSNVQFANSAVIQSGTLSTSGGGSLGVASSNNLTLDGNAHGPLTIVGTYTGPNGSTTFLIGTINNTGVIQVAAQGNNTFLTMTGGVSLIGNGVVSLSTGGNGTAALATAGGNQLLTNVDNTLQGFGVIGWNGLEVTNQGTINANVSAATLTLNPSVFTNQGLLQATSGGILALSGSTINNRAGTIQVNGATSSVQFVNNVTIQGGTLAGVNNGVLTIPSGNAITLDGSTLGPLTIAGTYAVANSSTTNLLGTVNNTGSIQVNATGNNTFLTMVGPVSLTGAGSVTLSKGGNGTAAVATAGGSQTLTNVNNTLQGTGVIGWNGLNLVNQAGGIIDGNTPSTGTLTVNTPNTTNQGLLEATAGGTLGLQNSFNNLGGRILASGAGSTVQFISGSVQGGTLATASSGILTTPPGDTFTLDGSSQGALATAGTYVVGNGATTFLTGTINNTGAIQVNAVGNNTFLTMSGGVSLTGAGSVTLSTSGNGTAALATAGGNQLLTNLNNTLQGFGVIGWNGLEVTNQGTINANVSAATLTLNPSVFTNQGLLQASSGGILALSGSTISNRTGTIQVNGAASSVQFVNNATIQGGTLAGVNNGVLTIPSGNAITFDGSTLGSLTIAGTYAIANSSTTFLLGTINNTGAIQVNATGNNTFLTMTGAVSLTGGGSVTLTKGGNGTAALATAGGNQTLTNVNNTLQGTGVIGWNGLIVVNQGTINANLPAEGALVINGGFTNQGLLEATVGGTLVLSNSTLNNHGGTIDVNGSTSSVQFVNNAVVQGGTLATANGGVLTIPGGNSITLDGSSQGVLNIAGTYVVANSSTTFLLGTINNTGAIQVNAAGNNTFLSVAGPVSLTGAGTVTLTTTGNGAAEIAASSGNQTLANSGNALQGTGVIGANGLSVVNQGTINANVASSLVLNPNALTNQGMLEATGVGMLQVSTSVSNAGGSIVANGGGAAVQFANGITIQGGTLNGINGGFVGSFSGNVLNLDGTANAVLIAAGGTYTVGNNSTTNLFGTINNNGTVLLDSSESNTVLNAASGGATLTGTGSVMMTSGPNMFLGTSLLNAGNIILDSATFNVSAYTQNAGLFQVTATGNASSVSVGLNGGTAQVDGTLATSQGVNVTGSGTLSGNGTILSNVSMAGVTEAGDIPNPGILTIGINGVGSYTQSSAGAYDVVIGGLTAGTQYSQLNVPGTASLGGTLNVSLINNFVPAGGNQFVILTASSLSNQFVTTNLPPLPPNLSWAVNYTSTQVVLSVMASSQTFTLTVTTLGTGNGTVTDNFEQIDCVDTAGVQSGTCSASYNAGTTVNLTATPSENTTFGGWGGACSGVEGCSVLMNSNQVVTASFVPPPITMSAPFTCPGGIYPCQNVTAPPAVFNCPSGKNPCPDPNAHSLALTAAQVNSPFTMTVAANEVSMAQADGDCQFGQIPSTDFDCRFTSFFPFETLGNGDVIVPACDAYSNGNCVFYSVYFGTKGIEPPITDYNGPISWSIAWNNTSFLPNPNYPYQLNNLRLYDDPDYEASIITPYGTNCTVPMLINGNPTDPPIYCQFVFDITTYFDPHQPPDAGIGGKTKQFNDVVVAFPLNNAAPDLSVTKTADQTVVNAGSPIGYTIVMSNSAAPGTGSATNATLSDPLPAGADVNWSVSPPYTGPGICAITGIANGQTLTCTLGSLSPAIRTSVHVMSSNSSAGTYVNTATLAALNNPPQMATATIQVVGGSGPIATVRPSKVNFGNLYLGLPGVSFVTLSNTGNAPLIINSIKIAAPGNDLDDFHARSFCPSSLAAGKSCKILLTCLSDSDNYSPTATLAITDNAPGSPQTVPLSATIINPRARVVPKSLNFGNQQVGTTSPPQTVTLTNTGTTSLVLSKLTISGDFAFASGTTCSNGTTLAPNAQCVMNVTFTPKGKGKRVGCVEIHDNTLFQKQKVPLSGMGD